MPEVYAKHLNRSVITVFFLSYMSLCATPSYTLAFLGIPIMAVLAIPLAENLQQRFSIYTTASTIASVLFMCALPVYILSNGLVSGVIVLFMYIQIYSLLHIKERKNYMHILMMSLFIFIASLVLSPSSIVGFIFAALLYFSITSVLYIDRHHVACHSTLLGAAPESMRPSPLRARVRSLASIMALVTLAVFLFFPRTEAGIMGSTVKAERSKAGLAPTTNFDIVGRITGNTNTVMKVYFTEEPGGRFEEDKYWRVTTLDTYSPQGWSRKGLSSWSKRKDSSGYALRSHETVGESKSVYREVNYNAPTLYYEFVLSTSPDGIPVPLLNTVLHVQPVIARQTETSVAWSPEGDFGVEIDSRYDFRERFKAYSELLHPSIDELRNASVQYKDAMPLADYQRLTAHDLQPRTRELVSSLSNGQDTAIDKIQALGSYLTSNNFLYTDTIPVLDKENPLENFIHDVKQGHCELYAGAMTLMVRSLGIPARTVSGYRGGQWDGLDQSYIVSENMAHLWVEVYFPDIGWVSFDPTPTYTEPEMTLLRSFQSYIDYGLTRMRSLWLKYVIAYKPAFEISPFDGKALVSWGGWISSMLSIGTPNSFTPMEHLKGVLVLLFPVLLGVAIYFLRRNAVHSKKRKHALLTNTQDQARRLYRLLLHKLSGLDVDVQDLTAEELSLQLNRVDIFPQSVIEELSGFIVRYHETRFGGYPLASDEVKRYTTLIKQLQRPPVTLE